MKPEYYAQALYELIEANKENKEKTLDAFIAMLKAHDAISLLPKILLALKKIIKISAGQEPTLTIASADSKAAILSEIGYQLEQAGADTHIKTNIDETLIGGYRLEYAGNLIDASYKNQLLHLYREITTH